MGERGQRLRAEVTERLNELFILVERTIAEYEEELSECKEENQRKQSLLDQLLSPRVLLQRTDVDEQKLLVNSPDPDPDESSIPFCVSPVQTQTEAALVKSEFESESDQNYRQCHNCAVCGKDCSSVRDLKRHMCTHTGEKPFSWSVCHTGFLDRSDLTSHATDGPGNGTHSDVDEQKLLVSSPDPDPDESSIPFCASPAQTQTEAAESGSGQSRNYRQCPVCGKDCASVRDLKRHMCTHTGERPFRCSMCSKGFIRKYQLIRHMRNHTGERPFSCSVCHRDFLDRSNLNKHMKSHATDGPGDETHSDVGEQQGALDSSVPEEAPSEAAVDKSESGSGHSRRRSCKPHTYRQCPVCGKECSSVRDLRRHMCTHTGERPFSCSMCSKGFIRKDQLARHMRNHTGERPFSCSVCHRDFLNGSNLNKHMKTHATDGPGTHSDVAEQQMSLGCSDSDSEEWTALVSGQTQPEASADEFRSGPQHVCPVCGNNFYSKTDLRKHMRNHTGERPFSCSVCDTGFDDSAALVVHLETHATDGPDVNGQMQQMQQVQQVQQVVCAWSEDLLQLEQT